MASELLVITHDYQPLRTLRRLSGEVISIVPEINETIYQQHYYPTLVKPRSEVHDEEQINDPLTNGLVTSIYTPLREWIKANHPKDFQTIQERVKHLPNKEYQLLGDPYVHAILPLLPAEDQRTLLEMGRQAFEEDFGFAPKGLWLPETAVSTETLRIVKSVGYEFTILADYQMENSAHIPMSIDLGDGEYFTVIPFASGKSATLSYEDYFSYDATVALDEYLNNGTNVLASDGELYGHHKADRDLFLLYLLDYAKKRRDRGVVSIQKLLKEHDIFPVTRVYENSSWSCSHGNLGRWTGACNCGDPTPTSAVLQEKHHLFTTLSAQNASINQELDALYPNWREPFTSLTVMLRQKIYTGQDFHTPLKNALGNKTAIYRLFAAKMDALLGFQSCAWFFSDEKREERKIPYAMIEDIDALLHVNQPQRDRRAS